MRSSILLLTILLFTGLASATPPTRIPISEAIQKNLIKLEAEATGNSYMKQGLKFTIENRGSLSFILVMDIGATFKPEEEGYQPLILAGGETVFLGPLRKGEQIKVQTFCGNSDASAPKEGIKYTYSGKASDTLVTILDFISKRRMFNSLGQSAVWVFTNGHDLNTVYDGGNDVMSKQLLEHIIKNTDRTMPSYFVENKINTEAGATAYEPKTLKIYAQFEEELKQPATLTLGVYNQAGEMIQSVFENRRYGSAGHRFRVQFEAQGVEAGKYHIRLSDENGVRQETEVIVQ